MKCGDLIQTKDGVCIPNAVREKNLARIERDGCWDYEEGLTKFLNARSKENVDRVFIPTKVIFSGPTTICFFADGTKEVVRQSAEEPDFDAEKAMMYCIVKRIMRHFPGDTNAINKYGYFKRQISSLAEEAYDECDD